MNCAAYDTARFVHNLEKGLEAAWIKCETGGQADHVFVEDVDPVVSIAEDSVFDGVGGPMQPLLDIMEQPSSGN